MNLELGKMINKTRVDIVTRVLTKEGYEVNLEEIKKNYSELYLSKNIFDSYRKLESHIKKNYLCDGESNEKDPLNEKTINSHHDHQENIQNEFNKGPPIWLIYFYWISSLYIAIASYFIYAVESGNILYDSSYTNLISKSFTNFIGLFLGK